MHEETSRASLTGHEGATGLLERILRSELELEQYCDSARRMHQRLVFTNGAFDLLHVGHALLFETAKRYGDLLIVGVNTDVSIGKYKPVKDGIVRPIYGELERAMSVAALRAVDIVYLSDAPSWEAALEVIRPAFWVRGASYGQEHCIRMEDHPEGRVVTHHGGECKVVHMAGDYSTTNLIAKLRTLEIQ